jgi:2-polyprenyl-3-methyl-5-hydroxy-6-metoxy-1,4-benzoquinol methylase
MDKADILETNKRQKEFYNSGDSSKKSLASKVWFGLRNGLLSSYRKQFGLKDKVYDEHKRWLGDISDKRILDLGCLRGNALSIYMAERAKRYIGIDLSDVAIEQLQKKIDATTTNDAEAKAVDFLSDDFDEGDFDIIYAYGVLHHFENVDLLIETLNSKLAPVGVIISYDPLTTSLPIRTFRAIYRPFQSDKDWEWPFDKKTLKKFDKTFNIKEKKGILGRSKYGIPINFLPLGRGYKTRVIGKMIDNDWNAQSWARIHSCMHLTMLMEKK